MGDDVALGSSVAGRYRIVREIGRGGLGQVYEAETLGGERVALKVLREPRADARARMLREARAIRAVAHPNVCRILDVLDVDGAPVLVMELLEGKPLAAFVGVDRPVGRTVTWLAEAAAALGAAHAAGIVHRDVKPQNLFIRGADDALVVLDFGIAKLDGPLDEQTITSTGGAPGTPAYMAPEQVFAEASADHRVDVWALGLVAYELFSGELPTRGVSSGQTLKRVVEGRIRPLHEAAPSVPAELASLVDRMISRSVDERPRDMGAVVDALRPFVTRPLASVARARPAGRGALIASVVGGVAALATAAVFATKVGTSPAPPSASVRGSAVPVPVEPSVPSVAAVAAAPPGPPSAAASTTTSPAPRPTGRGAVRAPPTDPMDDRF
ncbi:MAG: serine/threonine-protein kinase [Polyangiaceae bacterium]